MATVFDNIVNPDTTPFIGKVGFRMTPAPRFRLTDVATQADVLVAASTGGFISTALVGGTYTVFVGSSLPFTIRVPANDSAYVLRDLREDRYSDGTFAPVPADAGLVGYNYRFSNGVLQILNATTGRWHAIWLAEVPEVGSVLTIGPENNPGEDIVSRVEGTSFQIRNVDTGDYQSIYVTGADPDFTIAVSDPMTPQSDNYRYSNQRLQFLNPDTGLWHTIYIYGSGVSIGFQISEGTI